jgi:head-tail adaptor
MTGIVVTSSELDRQITFQRKVPATGFASAGKEKWENVPTAVNIAAGVLDVLPSRSEKLADGLTIANRPSRIRMRYRADITSDMRIIYGTRVMQIVAGPVELGRRGGLELVAEDYSTAGGVA